MFTKLDYSIQCVLTKSNRIKLKQFLLFAIILFNSGWFFLYGIAKLIGLQFVYKAPPTDLLLKDVSATGIMWYFFSLKKGYAILVALGELLPALLIIFKKTRFIGALFYLITIINILAINTFFDITIYTFSLSVILFINTLIILFSERNKFKLLLQ